MNLIDEAWIPVLRADATREYIRPWEITKNIKKNPIVALDAVRADFNGALIQFLIGLVQTVATPEDEDDWIEFYKNPSAPEKLHELMKPIAGYFVLDGKKSAFMQEAGLDDGAEVDIASLLIDAPGANGIKNNTDHFIKRGRSDKICPTCAATALFTLHTNAPSGGAGHRTSLRGGGPLTTIAMPDVTNASYATLWHSVWLNILLKQELRATNCESNKSKAENKFPWIGSIKTSKEDGSETTAGEIHPVQIYWSMPRRIKLSPPIEEATECDLCGSATDSYYTDYITKPYGINYHAGILHPLSPYYKDNKNQLLPVHPQPGGFTYRHWPQYVFGKGDNGINRAEVIRQLEVRMQWLKDEGFNHKTSVFVFGYDMDNMKARCWYEAMMPYYVFPKELDHAREDLMVFSQNFASAAQSIARNTKNAVKDAWIDKEASSRGDLNFVETEFWNVTEREYYNQITGMLEQLERGEAVSGELRLNWIKYLNKESLRIFDSYADQVPLDSGKEKNPGASGEGREIPRVISARSSLFNFNFGKNVKEILGLEMQSKAKKTGGKHAKSK